MRPFTFNLMLLLQRADEALGAERLKPRPDRYVLTMLRRKRRQLGARLRRSLAAPAPIMG
jgi:hypothetical protein